MMMSQMDLLVTNVAELLTAAVQEVLQLMGQAVLEYQKEFARTRLENHNLQQKLKELQQRTAEASDEVLKVSCPRDELYSQKVRVKEDLIYYEDSAVSEKTEQPECLSNNSAHINPVLGETGVDNQHHSFQGACDYTSKKQRPLSSPPRTIPNPSRGSKETPLGSNRIKVESKPEPLECSVTGNTEDVAPPAPGVPMQDAPFANEHNQQPVSSFSDNISHYNQPSKLASSTSRHILKSRVENTIHTGVYSAPIISESREILHSCHVCGKTFATASSLGAHFVCHSNERPFVCKCCKFSFSRLADLKKHERIHTGERPYNCSLCGRRFNRTENLKRHLRKVHYEAVL